MHEDSWWSVVTCCICMFSFIPVYGLCVCYSERRAPSLCTTGGNALSPVIRAPETALPLSLVDNVQREAPRSGPQREIERANERRRRAVHRRPVQPLLDTRVRLDQHVLHLVRDQHLPARRVGDGVVDRPSRTELDQGAVGDGPAPVALDVAAVDLELVGDEVLLVKRGGYLDPPFREGEGDNEATLVAGEQLRRG